MFTMFFFKICVCGSPNNQLYIYWSIKFKGQQLLVIIKHKRYFINEGNKIKKKKHKNSLKSNQQDNIDDIMLRGRNLEC